MKIGVFSRLRPTNLNNFEKWPTRVQKLDHPGIRQSNYRTGAPQASGMFHWGSTPPKRLKTTDLNSHMLKLFRIAKTAIIEKHNVLKVFSD